MTLLRLLAALAWPARRRAGAGGVAAHPLRIIVPFPAGGAPTRNRG